MELRVLRYFLTVVREENISRAAKILHMTQPSLSRQLSQLEKELGTQLFIRGKTLSLTDAGFMLRRRAEEVLEMIDKIESEFEEKNDLSGVISIGSGGLSASEHLLAVMNEFQKQYPKVQYDFYLNNADYVKERLDSGLLDFGLLMEPIDVSKYDYIRMQEKERWGLLMPTTSPLAAKTYITKKDLLGLRLIAPSRASVQQEISTWLGEDFNKLNIFATHNLIASSINLVSTGLVYALTIEGAVNMFEGEHLAFKPFKPELASTSVFAWKKFQPYVGTAGKFLEYFKSRQIAGEIL